MPSPRPSRFAPASVLLAWAALAACSADELGAPVTVDVAATGALVAHPSGAWVVVPPGAFESGTKLTIERVVPAPGSDTLLAHTFAITASAVARRPVDVFVRFDRNVLAAAQGTASMVRLLRRGADQPGGAFVVSGAAAADGVVHARSIALGTFSAVLPSSDRRVVASALELVSTTVNGTSASPRLVTLENGSGAKVLAGVLPAGLSLLGDSTLTGAPAQAGLTGVQVAVTAGAGVVVEGASLIAARSAQPPLAGVSTLTPSTAPAQSAALELLVGGTQFEPRAQVFFDDAPLATAYVDTTRLVAFVPASLLEEARSITVTVLNARDQQPTASGTFRVLDPRPANPVPMLTAIAPQRLPWRTGPQTVVLVGSGFTAQTTASDGTRTLSATRSSATQLNVVVDTDAYESPTTIRISASNPAPGGGTSSPLSLELYEQTDAGEADGGEAGDAGDGGSGDAGEPDAGTPDGGADGGSIGGFAYAQPHIDRVEPLEAAQYASGSVHTLHGTGFGEETEVFVGSTRVQRGSFSDTSVQFVVPAALLDAVQAWQVTASNPRPGGGASNAAELQVVAAEPPPASVGSVFPPRLPVDAPDRILTLEGAGFGPDVSVQVRGGAPLAIERVTSTKLLALLRTTDHPGAGELLLDVTSGGVVSQKPARLTIDAAGTYHATLAQPANADSYVCLGTDYTASLPGGAQLRPGVQAFVRFSASVQRISSERLSDGELQIAIAGTQLVNPGPYLVYAENPAPTGTARSTEITIIADALPLPVSLSPAEVQAGSLALDVEVTTSRCALSRLAELPTVYVNDQAVATRREGDKLVATLPRDLLQSTAVHRVRLGLASSGRKGSTSVPFRVVADGNPVPRITGVSPAQGERGANAVKQVTVTGTNITNATRLVVGSVLLGTPSSVSGNSATYDVGDRLASGPDTVPLRLVNPAPGGGASSFSSFTLTGSHPLPVLNSVNPTSLSRGVPEQTVNLYGTNFTRASKVLVDGVEAKNASCDAAAFCRVTLPASALGGSGVSLSVTTPAPGGGTSQAKTLTIGATPKPWYVAAALPTLRAGGGAQRVTLVGGNYGANTRVNGGTSFQGATPLTIVEAAPSSLTFELPESLTAQPQNLYVSVGTSTSAEYFSIGLRVGHFPVITSLGPATAPKGAAFQLSIAGDFSTAEGNLGVVNAFDSSFYVQDVASPWRVLVPSSALPRARLAEVWVSYEMRLLRSDAVPFVVTEQ